jgi:hypothetical protein
VYSIPPNPDLSGIIGSPLIQICLGEHDLQFHFDSGSWMGSQATVQHSKNEVMLGSWGAKGLTSTSLNSLLGKSPMQWAVPNPKRLELHFENDQVLAFLDDSDQFESFQIYKFGEIMPSLVV